MIAKFSLLLPVALCAALSVFAAPLDKQEVSLPSPVQIPEAVLDPGQYSIQLEDHLPDRAIVRISGSNGTDHYLLVVPSNTLTASGKGLIYFTGSASPQALSGWECSSCSKPLEVVYPKDEAVKLTAQTGKSVLAYDPSYDKLPANLSAEDRKVVTLWLLSPKTVTPDGKGEGVAAAKFSQPKMTAAAVLPKKMPKTATNAALQMLAGLFLLFSVPALAVARKQFGR